MRRSAPPCLISLAVALAVSCAEDSAGRADPAEPRGRLTVTGSSTVAPLVGQIARRFEASHPGARIDVQSGGTARGIADVRRGIAGIALASRALHPDEQDLEAHTIAIDGIGLIVHRDNRGDALSDRQIVQIFTGRIASWKDVGGSDAPITVVNKADGRATLERFLEHFELGRGQIRAGVVIGDNQQGIRTIVGDPHAVGYVSIGTAAFEAARGVPIRLLPVGGIEPTVEHVRSGAYPLARPLNLVTHGERSPLTEAFIAFAGSSAVNDLVEAHYFVPVAE